MAASSAAPPEIERLREFLRIATVSHSGPDGAYADAVAFLRRQLARVDGAEVRVVEPLAGHPVVVATLRGRDPSLPSLLLNSHYDVVPADREKWSCDPFAAEVRDGAVWGRGVQDMKSVCMQYCEALARIAAGGRRPLRTVHATFVPDEEIGGADGMGRFVESDEFRELRVGVALDEGLANPEPGRFTVFYAERAVWWLRLRAAGPTGHASRFVEGAAMDRLMTSVARFLAYREEQRARLLGHDGCEHAVAAAKLGDVATVNLTMLRGGVSADGGRTFALNVVPTEAEAGFDIRIPPGIPLDDFEAKVREWTRDVGVEYEFDYRTPEHYVSDVDGPFYAALCSAVGRRGGTVETEVFPAGTDGRYVRGTGVPVFGFSPMDATPILLHDHDERLDCDVFLRGIDIYVDVVMAMAGVEE